MAYTIYFDKPLHSYFAQDQDPMCNHSQVTRLWDDNNSLRCDVCHRKPPPGLGWLYRCTQDWDGDLPASDFGGTEARPNNDAALYSLSPSIIEAANKGHYTDDELQVLCNQKKEVRNAILQARPNTASSATSTVSSGVFTLHRSTTTSSLRSSNTERENSLHFNTCRSLPQTIQEAHAEVLREPVVPPSLVRLITYPPPCNFKVCAICKPFFHERAWQSINSIVDNVFGLENRPPIRDAPDHVSILSSVDEIQSPDCGYLYISNPEGWFHHDNISLPNISASEISLVERPASAPPAPVSFRIRIWGFNYETE